MESELLNKVNVSFQGTNGAIEIRVFDVTGRVVLSESTVGHEGETQHQIDLGKSPKGAYLIEIQTTQFHFQEKVILH